MSLLFRPLTTGSGKRGFMECPPLNIHGLLERSEVNGPGVRAVIWLQGCDKRCPGCFNPDAQPLEPRRLMTPEQLFEWVRALEGVEGVTISGGEPFLQARPLGESLRLLRQQTDLSVIIYTGYRLEEAEQVEGGREVLALTDVLIDGPYDQTQPASDGIRGSVNQRLHLLSERYHPGDFHIGLRFEIVIRSDGTVIKTGVSSGSERADLPLPDRELP